MRNFDWPFGLMLATGVTSAKVARHDPPLPVDFETRTRLQIERLERRLVETQKKGDLLEESRLCNNTAKKYEELSQWKRALHFHHYDRQISEAAGDTDGVLMALGNMSRIFQEIGLIELARKYLKEQLRIATKERNFVQMFNAHCSIGLLLMREAEGAVELIKQERLVEVSIILMRAHEALDEYEKLIHEGVLSGGRRKDLKQLRLEGRLNDGRLHLVKGEFDVALLKFQVARDGFHEIADWKEREFEAIGLMGESYEGLSDAKSAVELCYDQQLEMAKDLCDAQLESMSLRNLALAYRLLHDFDLAIETLYLYKDQLKGFSTIETDEIREADRLLKETLRMKETAADVTRLEGKKQKRVKTSYKLARCCKDLGMIDDALSYAKQAIDFIPSDNDADQKLLCSIYKLTCQLCIQKRCGEEAIYYAKKYEEALSVAEEDDDRYDLVICLADAYWLLPTLPLDTVRLLEEWLFKSKTDTITNGNSIEILSRLALSCQRLGLNSKYEQYKDECLSLWMATQLSDRQVEERVAKIERELAELDYFANRKASKSVMKLVDGNFNMKSRSKATKGLLIKRGVKSEVSKFYSESSPSTAQRSSVTRRTRSKTFIIDDDTTGSPGEQEDLDRRDNCRKSRLDDFIDDTPLSMIEEAKELVWPSSPKRRPQTMALCDDDKQSTRSLSSSGCTWSKESAAIIPMTSACIAAVLRVIVLIEDFSMIVPVIDDIAERKTVAWLIREIGERCKSEFKREPIIEGLFTEDGARISSCDPVAIVLCDGQRVRVRVTGFKSKSLIACYEEICSDHHATPNLTHQIVCNEEDIRLWPAAPDDVQTDMLLQAIVKYVKLEGSSTTIKHLDLSKINLQTSKILQEIRISSLRRLDLSFTMIDNCSWIIDAFPKLEELSLSFCCELSDLSHLLARLSRTVDYPLRVLNLVGCDHLDGCNFKDLFLLPSLSLLNISFCKVGHQAASSIAELLKKSSSLKILKMTGCAIEDACIDVIFLALQVNVSLVEFNVLGIPLSPERILLLESSIKGNPRSSLTNLQSDYRRENYLL